MPDCIRKSLVTLLALVAIALASLPGSAPAQAQAALTGVTIVGANGAGAPLPFYDWYTQPAPPNYAWKVWLINGTNRNGPFINGPTGDRSNINIPLTPGTYTYTVFVAHNTIFAGTRADPPAFGINLFFNGAAAPDLSAHAPTQTSLSSLPVYQATSSAITTRGYDGRTFPAAGALSRQVGGMEISLVDWRMTAMPVYGMSRVGSLSAVPSGLPSNVGQFTIRVEPISGTPGSKLQISWNGANADRSPDFMGNLFLNHHIVVRNVGSQTARNVTIRSASYASMSAISFEAHVLSYVLWPLFSRPYELGDIPPGAAVVFSTPGFVHAGIQFAVHVARGLPPAGSKHALRITGTSSVGPFDVILRGIPMP